MRKDITKNYIRERQFNPNVCKKDSFRIKKVSSKTKIVLCRKKGSNKQSVQSILTKRSQSMEKEKYNRDKHNPFNEQ